MLHVAGTGQLVPQLVDGGADLSERRLGVAELDELERDAVEAFGDRREECVWEVLEQVGQLGLDSLDLLGDVGSAARSPSLDLVHDVCEVGQLKVVVLGPFLVATSSDVAQFGDCRCELLDAWPYIGRGCEARLHDLEDRVDALGQRCQLRADPSF